MNAERQNAHARLWAMGYRRLVPIIPPGAPLSVHSSLHKRMTKNPAADGRGKAPGVRGRDGLWRGFDWRAHVPDERDLTRWREMEAGAGVRLGEGLAAIDADTLDERLADLIRAEVERACGLAPTRIGQAPKALYLVRTDVDAPYQLLTFGAADHRERVEILTEGRQFVAAGTHPGTLAPYRWTQALVPYDQLPYVPVTRLTELMSRLRDILPAAAPVLTQTADIDVDQETLRGDPDLVRAAISALPNTSKSFASRESYLAVGYAIRAALPDDEGLALELFQNWCGRWEDGENDPDTVAADFHRMKPPYRRGSAWLYETVRRESGGAFDPRAVQFFEPPVEEGAGLFPPEASAAPVSLLGKPYVFRGALEIEPREFLYGSHYQRCYASVTIAPTKVGKSSLGIVEALAMASGRPLLGVEPEGRCRVRIWNGEDPYAELERRIAAAMQHYGLTPEDVGDRLLVDSGRDQPIVVARQERGGAIINAPVVGALIEALRTQSVDALLIDPFVKSHRVLENDNSAVDAVAAEWNRAAGLTRCAIDLVHHSRKMNGGEASIDDARGASALVSAARAARVLARMTQAQGRALGRGDDYRRLFRFADAQSNMAAPPRGLDETWLEIVSVDLRNARFDADGRQIRRGDTVGVVTVSRTRGGGDPGEIAEADASRESAALRALAGGEYKLDTRTGDGWAGVPIAHAFGLDLSSPDDKSRAAAILKRWIRDGRLREVSRPDRHRNLRIFVEPAQQGEIADDF